VPAKAISRPNCSVRDLESALTAAADPERARNLAWFFKTGKGEYGEGDRFLGIRVPIQRKIALAHRGIPLADIARLLASPIHEFRFSALEILVAQCDSEPRQEIFDFYLQNTAGINNWDLVDTSAPYIVGEHLLTRERSILDKLAASPNLWERRIAIVSTLTLIKHGELADTFRIAAKLLTDKHDLTHKAAGWALRESGRQSRPALLEFLRAHYAALPRTSLRYAIEHFSAEQRKNLLAGNFERVNLEREP
jgi:3-methyladenine DNA glycosylase AlkD